MSDFDLINSRFSCDLIANSIKHKYFLQLVHHLGVSLHVLSPESLHRYQDLWLPLVYACGLSVELIPPPDIAWLWHCHRLAPRNYVACIRDKFGRGVMVEANPPFTLQTAEYEADPQLNDPTSTVNVALETRARWTEAYPNKPFFLDGTTQEPDLRLSQDASVCHPLLDDGFDLIGSTQRQAGFLWQISGYHFNDPDFLEEGVENYYKFLCLKPKMAQGDPHILLVPTFQIDLMWHTHILSSIVKYNQDCLAIMGSTLHHDDSTNDRSEGGVLDVSYSETRK